MKVLSICVLGVLGLASAQQNLRASSAKIDDSTLSLINTSVIYEGIKTEHATIEDTGIIQMSVAAALDEIYGSGEPDSEADNGMLGACGFICRIVRDRNPPTVGPPPPKAPETVCGAWGCGPYYGKPYYYVESDGRCGPRCGGPDGDRWGNRRKRHHILGTAAATADGEETTSMALVSMQGKIPEIQDLTLREKFDELVCDNMRSSGSKALEDVHDCEVYFYAMEQPICATNDVFIKIDGVAIQSKEDFIKIEMAATAAGLENLTVQMISGIADAAAPKTFVLADVEQSDNNCNAKVDATAHSFCASLHDHGFEAAHGCEIAAFGVSMMMAQGEATVDMEVA